MGKLTGRSPIVTADVDEDLLIHVVDTAGTPASFKATLSQLYAVFPKNSSAGAGDVNKVPKWTATNELGASIIEDNGSKATISGVLSLEGTGAGKLNLVNTVAQDTSGSNYMNWYESDGTSRRGYLGFTDPNTFNINVQESAGTSQIVLDADEIIFNSVSGTDSSTITTGVWEGTPIADAYIAENYLIATSGAAQRIAVFDGTDSVEGDANLTYTGSTLIIANSSNANTSNIASTYLQSKVETDDANCLLYGYGTSNSGELVLASARGTIASPTATQSGDTLGEIGIFGAVPGLRPGARILFQATENYVDTSNYGTKFVIQTTKNGTATLATRYTIDGDGNHGFVGDIKYSQQVYQDGGIYNGGSTGASFTPNFINGNLQKVTMSNASITITNPTNAKDGATYTICFVQDATASRTISTWGSDWNWGDSGAPDFSGGTAAGDKFYVTVIVNGTTLDAIYSGVKH